MSKDILTEKVKAVNIGAELFATALQTQQVETMRLAWAPPRRATVAPHLTGVIAKMAESEAKITAANEAVITLMQRSDPYWIGMQPAIECVPDMHEGLILHSGPAIEWERMCEAQRQGGINGALFEGYAATEAEARRLLEKGEIEFASANDYHICGPGSGIATPSMVVNIVEDRNTGARGFCAPFEGPNRGGLAGWGVYNPAIKKHLDMVRESIAPAFNQILAQNDGLALKRIFIRGVEMGDELHSRQDACGLIAVNELMQLLFESDLDRAAVKKCVDLMYGTTRYFHPLGMASAMALLESVRQVEYSTVITAMEGNGVDFGIKVSGTGNQWFTAPSPMLEGALVAANIDPDEILPWIGDSCMLEAVGLGGFAAAAAPAVMRAREKTLTEGIAQTREMEQITLATHDYYLLPALDYQGSPLGIDLRKILETGITPVVHGGIISKNLKRLGAGAARVPMKCFEDALKGFAAQYGLVKK